MDSEYFLKYRQGRHSQASVKRAYMQWRQSQQPPIPERCDNTKCYFYANPCKWNGEKLNLILDHKNGVSGDNRTKNLRLLCPNCNSQLSTHGGGNKGKVEMSVGGFAVKRPDGKRDYHLPVEPGFYKMTTTDSGPKRKRIRKTAPNAG